ncbi:hypothetical protein LP419_17595 [Massilia sp. H-1]|nr:hypothetical protein LP419_17595 [Massilia sp. H-1]
MFAPRVMISMEDLRASGLLASGALADYYLLVADEALGAGQLPARVRPGRAQGAAARDAGHQQRGRQRRAGQGGPVPVADRFAGGAARQRGRGHGRAPLHAAPPGRSRHAALPGHAAVARAGHVRARIALVGVGASAIGAALGFGAHFVLIEWLGTLVTADMAPPGWAPKH